MSKKEFVAVESLVSNRDESPRIQITYKNEIVQLSASEGREHALYILECCEAAEMDSIVLKFLKTKLNIDLPRAVVLIKELRKYRGGE